NPPFFEFHSILVQFAKCFQLHGNLILELFWTQSLHLFSKDLLGLISKELAHLNPAEISTITLLSPFEGEWIVFVSNAPILEKTVVATLGRRSCRVRSADWIAQAEASHVALTAGVSIHGELARLSCWPPC